MKRQKVWVRMGMWAALPALVLLLSSAIPTQTAAGSRPVSPWRETASAAPNAGWHEVGAHSATGSGISDNQGGSSPAIAIAPDGTAYVAWQGSDGTDGEIYIRRWDGSAWIEVGAGSATGGGVSNNDLDSSDVSLAIAPDGTPYLAWADLDEESDYSQHIYVWRWNGSAWVQVGTGAVSADYYSDFMAGSHDPALAIAPDGTPYVAWYYWSDNASYIYVWRWNGSAWVQVGSESLGGGGLGEMSFPGVPAVAMAPDGQLYVAWNEHQLGAEGGEVYVRRWNGSAWVEVGAGSATGGGISNSGEHAGSVSIAVASEGTVYVAWTDASSTDTEIYVRRWNGGVWTEVGAGSASGGGVSNDDAASDSPWLAVAPDGTPYVTWLGSGDLDSEIYVRRWTGSAWEEAGAGSAAGGGISDNASDSDSPVLAVDPDGQVWAAWADDGDGDDEIYVRRWSPELMHWLPIVFGE